MLKEYQNFDFLIIKYVLYIIGISPDYFQRIVAILDKVMFSQQLDLPQIIYYNSDFN